MSMEELLKQIVWLKEEVASMKQSQSLPIGVVEAFATPTPPVGWVVCNGQELRIDEYRELFNAIGKVFNDENTSEGFFCVPDLQGRFIRGWDEDGNVDPEREFGTPQLDAIQGHYHNLFQESNKTKEGGKHDHYIGYEEKTFDYATISGSSKSCKSVCGHSEPHELSYGDDRAIHSHELPKLKIREVIDGNCLKVNVTNETRPKNIALLYCIKVK